MSINCLMISFDKLSFFSSIFVCKTKKSAIDLYTLFSCSILLFSWVKVNIFILSFKTSLFLISANISLLFINSSIWFLNSFEYISFCTKKLSIDDTFFISKKLKFSWINSSKLKTWFILSNNCFKSFFDTNEL